MADSISNVDPMNTRIVIDPELGLGGGRGGRGGGRGGRGGRGGGRMAFHRQQLHIVDNPQKIVWRSDNGNTFYIFAECERPCIVVIPAYNAHRMSEMPAIELALFWADITLFAYTHHINARQVIIHTNDYRISPHVHAKINLLRQEDIRRFVQEAPPVVAV